jgi:hypothetical protein
MVRNFAHDICGIWPAKNWPGRFSERWKDELASGYLSGIDLSRKKADNEYQYGQYFQKVCSYIMVFVVNIS